MISISTLFSLDVTLVQHELETWLQKNIAFTSETALDCVTPQTQGLLIRAQHKVNTEVLERLPNLKFIITATSGFDHIDLKTCIDRGIQVAHCPQAHIDSTAQLTLLHLLQILRFNDPQKNWTSELWRPPYRGRQLSDQTIGIFGFGRIGKRVSELLKVFDVSCLVFDPYQSSELSVAHFSDFLRRCDIISLHAPLTALTRKLWNAEVLQQMPNGAYLINCARGELIDESAVLSALESGQLAGYAADAFSTEPLPKNHPFWMHPQISLTPHLGAYTQQAFSKSSLECLQTMQTLLGQGSHPACLLPDSLPWARDLWL